MKRLLLSVAIGMASLVLNAQDVIIFQDGTELEVKVTEVSETQVRYKAWSNLEGPTFVKNIADIFQIRYENGQKQTFTQQQQAQQQPVNTQPTLHDIAAIQRGMEIAKEEHYPAEGPWLLYGFTMKEGPNLYFSSDETIGKTRYRAKLGVQYLPSVEGFIEFAWKQKDMPINRDALFFGLQYSFRGGHCDDSPKSFVNLQYLCFRPGYSTEGKVFYFRTGVELGVLTYSHSSDIETPSYDIREYCNKATFGLWLEMGWTIKKHFLLGWGFTYVATNSTKDLWGYYNDSGIFYPFDNNYSPNLNIQIHLGWRFNPYKIDKRKVEAISWDND